MIPTTFEKTLYTRILASLSFRAWMKSLCIELGEVGKPLPMLELQRRIEAADRKAFVKVLGKKK